MSIRTRVNARSMDQHVLFQRKVESPQDAATGALPATLWTDVLTCWARVDSARVDNIAASLASEDFLAQQKIAVRGYTVWIRWRNDIDSNMRIVWNSQLLDIVGIPDNQKRGRMLAIFCHQGANEG